MADSTEARKAWYALRLPYLVAYISLLVTAVVHPPLRVDIGIWKFLVVFTSITLIVGSVGSFIDVAKPGKTLGVRYLAVLEVTGLRALWMMELIFSLYRLLSGSEPQFLLSALHLAIAAFAFGSLQALTWHRGRSRHAE